MKFRDNRWLRVQALAALLMVTACHNPAEPTRATTAGAWIGEAQGVLIQLQITEQATAEPIFFQLSGNGVLTMILATSQTLAVTVSGYALSSGTVVANLYTDARSSGTYGQFKGQASAKSLTGSIDNFPTNTTGPFAGQPSVAIVFKRP